MSMLKKILGSCTFAPFLLLGLLSFEAVAQENPPTTGRLLGDAKVIVTSDKNDVRLWGHPPRVVVIASDPLVIQELERIRARLEQEVTPFYGDKVFGRWQYVDLPQDFAAGEERLRFRLVNGGPSDRQVVLRLGPEDVYLADIVIAVADRPTIAVLNGLWGLSRSYGRSQMQGGRARCYYSAYSKKGLRYGAFVSIVPPKKKSSLSECLWEEVLHTLGPLTDAKGSVFFTFDDQVGTSTQKMANDIALIRALYESGARPGDPPDAVISYLAKMLNFAMQ